MSLRRARDIARAEGVLPEHDTLLIDGTGLSMPDTPENQERFPQPASQEPGCGFPQGRMVGLMCATTGVLVDAALSAAKGKGSDESTALRALSAGVAAGNGADRGRDLRELLDVGDATRRRLRRDLRDQRQPLSRAAGQAQAARDDRATVAPCAG